MTQFQEEELFESIIFVLASSGWGEDKTSAQIEDKAHEIMDGLDEQKG